MATPEDYHAEAGRGDADSDDLRGAPREASPPKSEESEAVEHSSVDELLARARRVHTHEVGRLQRELGRLQVELAGSRRTSHAGREAPSRAPTPKLSSSELLGTPWQSWQRSLSEDHNTLQPPASSRRSSDEGGGSPRPPPSWQQRPRAHSQGSRSEPVAVRGDEGGHHLQLHPVHLAPPRQQRPSMDSQGSRSEPPAAHGEEGGHLCPPPVALDAQDTGSGSMQEESPDLAAAFKQRRGLSATFTRQIKKYKLWEGKGWSWKLVHDPAFDLVISALICANGLLMAAEAQYNGFDLAQWSGHRSASGPSATVWPAAESVFDICQYVFGLIFLAEIVFKMFAMRCAFCDDAWNWIDLSLVVLWVCGRILKHIVNAQFSMLRLARLARLVRLVRVVKFMHSAQFDSLYLMATALKGSLSLLTWSFALLFVMHFILALLINQILREFYFDSDPSNWTAGHAEVFEYYGSFSRSFITMFEITTANWPQACRVLVEDVHEAFMIYAVLHKMILGFAVIGIINGVFVQETFKVATLDDAVMVRQTMRKQRVHNSKMQRLFNEADVNRDGTIGLDEWQDICRDEWVQIWLASQDLNVSDAELLFELLDDGDGNLTAQELIQGTARLKGSAASMNLVSKIRQVGMDVQSVKQELVTQRSMIEERMMPGECRCGC